MVVELKVPSAGESVEKVQIGAWLKQVGQRVERDEPVCEIETDKASMELPAPAAGTIKSLLKQPGESAKVGDVIALIDPAAAPSVAIPAAKPAPASAADGASRTSGSAPRPTATPTAAPSTGTASTAAAPSAGSARGATDGGPRIMPAARRALAEHGVAPADVTPTGPGGRILKEDVERHVAQGIALTPSPATPVATPAPGAAAPVAAPASGADAHVAAPASGAAASVAAGAPPAAADREEEAIPMTTLRRRVAERLVTAQQQAALLTTFNEIDMSAVLRLRDERNEAFQKKYGIKLGFMPFFVKAAIDALRQFPAVNAEIRDLPGPDGLPAPHIVYKNYFDIGVAVSTERGLVVPVLRGAERLSFAEVELAIADLAARARDKKLSVEELQGGTFTISNGGVFGSLMSTPIINPPQSGILGLHAIQERPVARGGQVVIRPMMYVALTYDHRIIDGRESVSFLKRVKECVEEPVRMLVEV